jgi:hypothetical protein
MPDAEAPGAAESAAALAGLGRSGIGDSAAPEPFAVPGAAESPWGTVFPGAPPDGWELPPAKLGPGGLSPAASFGMPAAARSGSLLAGANGGGCGGRPAATRWRTTGVAARSELVEVTDSGSPADVPAPLGGGTSTGAGPGLEVAGAASGRACSRLLPPGGVSSEFTAYAPTSTPTTAATTEFGLVSTPPPRWRLHA